MDIIPFAKPALNGNEDLYVTKAMDAGWISGTGEYVTKFENALANQIGRKRCIAVSNGTTALEVVLQAMGIGQGDEVIVPALTFVAPVAAVVRAGAIPVFADVYDDTFTLNPDSVKLVITRNTKAIIAVDLLGNVADFENLAQFQIPIIEDAAEAHGAHEPDKWLRVAGRNGLVSTFSFHPNKTLVMGEGGAILTDWDLLANKCRLIANHGMEKGYYHTVVGTNARPNNLTCAIGLAQVEKWTEHISERRKVYNRYYSKLKDLDLLFHRQTGVWVVTIFHPKRDYILEQLHKNQIDARAMFVPIPELPIYNRYATLKEYPVAHYAGKRGLMLPTYERMTDEEIDRVVNTIKEAIE